MIQRKNTEKEKAKATDEDVGCLWNRRWASNYDTMPTESSDDAASPKKKRNVVPDPPLFFFRILIQDGGSLFLILKESCVPRRDGSVLVTATGVLISQSVHQRISQ